MYTFIYLKTVSHVIWTFFSIGQMRMKVEKREFAWELMKVEKREFAWELMKVEKREFAWELMKVEKREFAWELMKVEKREFAWELMKVEKRKFAWELMKVDWTLLVKRAKTFIHFYEIWTSWKLMSLMRVGDQTQLSSTSHRRLCCVVIHESWGGCLTLDLTQPLESLQFDQLSCVLRNSVLLLAASRDD
jgi:hypothetical protein